MNFYRNPKTEKIFTEKELANLFKEMQDNGVEFLETFGQTPYRGGSINQRVDYQCYRYKNGNEIVEFRIEKITI